MQIPNLPTDNLYKFITLSGLIGCIFCVVAGHFILNEIEGEVTNLTTKRINLEFELKRIEKKDSDFINAIYTRVINALSEEVFQINLASLYDETMIFQNRNKISEEIYQQVLSFQNEFITNCKNKINSKLLSEYLKNFNYYLDCDAVISYYQNSITEQFFGLLIHIEMIISLVSH